MRRGLRGLMAAVLGTVMALLLSTAASASTEGKTQQGKPFVSGGVTASEMKALDARRDKFALQVVTAAKGTGAYLAGVRVKITDAKGTTVLDTALDGPVLLVELDLGRYTVEATRGQETLKRVTTIHKGDNHQAVFYFDAPKADLSPDLKK